MTTEKKDEDTRVSCYGGCGTKVQDPSKVGWTYLQITGKWRCYPCEKSLLDSGNVTGNNFDRGDELPKESIGALKEIKK